MAIQAQAVAALAVLAEEAPETQMGMAATVGPEEITALAAALAVAQMIVIQAESPAVARKVPSLLRIRPPRVDPSRPESPSTTSRTIPRPTSARPA